LGRIYVHIWLEIVIVLMYIGIFGINLSHRPNSCSHLVRNRNCSDVH
jgi:hypothetical protein